MGSCVVLDPIDFNFMHINSWNILENIYFWISLTIITYTATVLEKASIETKWYLGHKAVTQEWGINQTAIVI